MSSIVSAQRTSPESRSRFLLVALPTFLILGILGPSVEASSAGASNKWSEYFPKIIGESCSTKLPPSSVTDGSKTVATSSREVATLASIGDSSHREVFTFRDTISSRPSDSNPTGESALKPISSTQVLKYLLLSNGTVQAPLESQVGLTTELTFRGYLVFPSFADIRSGKGDNATLSFSLTPTTSAGIAQMKAITQDHVKSLLGYETLDVNGILRKTLSTATGTFRNVVGVREITTALVLQNMVNKNHVAAMEDEVIDSYGTIRTVWYAPDRGEVSLWSYSRNLRLIIESTKCEV